MGPSSLAEQAVRARLAGAIVRPLAGCAPTSCCGLICPTLKADDLCPSCAAPYPGRRPVLSQLWPRLHGHAGEERRITTVLFADLVGFTSLAEHWTPSRSSADRLAASSCWSTTSPPSAAGSTRSSATASWPCSARPSPTRTTPNEPCGPRCGCSGPSPSGSPISSRRSACASGSTPARCWSARSAGTEYTAMGDVVNTASRLQSAAPPGGVLVGPFTHAATVGAIAYESVGDVEVRGRGEKVVAWLAVEPVTLPGRRRRRTPVPFVGRELERSLLVDTVRIAQSQRRAVLAVVEGEGGVGKTRLVEEVLTGHVKQLGGTVLVGTCVPYGEANRWWPMASALGSRPRCRSGRADWPEIRSRLEQRLSMLIGPPTDQEHREALVNGLLHLFGQQSPLDGIDPARTHQELIRAVLAVLAALVVRGPLTLVIADLHWASLGVLELLEAAMARLASTPFALIATTRPGGELPAPPRSARVHLAGVAAGAASTRTAPASWSRPMLGDRATARPHRRALRPQRGKPALLGGAGRDGGRRGRDRSAARLAARPSWRPAWTSCRPTSGRCSTTPPCSGPLGRTAALVEFGQALGQNTARSLLDALADAGLPRGRRQLVAVPLGQRARRRLPHHHQGGPGPSPRRRGQGHGRGDH